MSNPGDCNVTFQSFLFKKKKKKKSRSITRLQHAPVGCMAPEDANGLGICALIVGAKPALPLSKAVIKSILFVGFPASA